MEDSGFLGAAPLDPLEIPGLQGRVLMYELEVASEMAQVLTSFSQPFDRTAAVAS